MSAPPRELSAAAVRLSAGKRLRHHAKAVRGTPENPMSAEEIEAKARDLIEPITGAARAEGLIVAIRQLEKLRSVRELRPLLHG